VAIVFSRVVIVVMVVVAVVVVVVAVVVGRSLLYIKCSR